MKIIKTEVSYKDKRGEIRDILTHIPVEAITYITFAKEAVRGNHYHKKSIQYLYILSGSLMAYGQKEKGKIESKRVKVSNLVFHEANERHAFRALEPAEVLSFNFGPRRGFDYEKDTYRLDKKLI